MDEEYEALEEDLGETVDMGAGEAGPLEVEDFAGDGELFVEGAEEDEEEEIRRLARALEPRLRALLPLLRRLAPAAARALLAGTRASPEEEEDGFEDGFEEEEELLGLEEEEEEDGESDRVPGLGPEAEALAEALAAAASRVPDPAEAAGLVGGVTIHILGPAPVRIRRTSPVLVRRAVRLARLLRRSPRTRPLTPVVANIVKKTARTLTKHARRGKPATAKAAVRSMAKHTAKTLGSPKRLAKALARNRVVRKRLSKKAILRAER
ncbi:MAG TPA: hypothetical protein ENK19_02270 [Acidobacteria bacterium]|nr:hypothetical protein [Acidobacteriota bacterium]